MPQKKTLLSGVQPSGQLMLGNYLGAIRNWVELQAQHDSLFCVVDLHAITTKQDPTELRRRTLEVAATYLACGIDPERSTVFLQSQVPEHCELAWILTCFSNMGELSRMTQFKDKSAKQKSIGTGLFTYPILMAADILLYQTHLVPVGQDQKQHLELARDLAIRMNSQVQENLFTVPEPFIPEHGAKVMSLADPLVKMSKSDPDPNSFISLFDSDDAITKKIKRSVTDSGTEISYSDDKPGIKNLISIQAAITGKSPVEIVQEHAGKQYGHLKLRTAEIVVECVRPIREKALNYLKDEGALAGLLKKGAENARRRAAGTMKRTKEALGFIACLAVLAAHLTGCASMPATPEAKLDPMPTQGPVGKTFSAHAEKFSACGRDSVSIQTADSQRLTFRFKVLPDGRVDEARVESMSSPDPDFQACVLRALSRIRFPKPKDKIEKHIRYSITVKAE